MTAASAALPAGWVAVDWGTTHLRAWAMRGADVMAHAQSADGHSTLAGGDFEGALLGLIGEWLGPGQTLVLAAGMVGARQGWSEAPYRPVPCAPVAAGALMAVPTRDPRLAVRIVPGLSQDAPADVMRGEEVQIAGYLAGQGSQTATLCLPGTHSKWVQLANGSVIRFDTAMTGELYALLSGQSVLRHAMAGSAWDDATFATAVTEALKRPAVLDELFAIRAQSLLQGLSPGAARARLSGLLIGAEIAMRRVRMDALQEVAVIGEGRIVALYTEALRIAGLRPHACDGAALVRAGLAVLHRQPAEQTGEMDR